MERLSKKLMNWASILDDATREQALRTAQLPFIHPWVALMSDAHLGKGATVGSVIPTLGAIIPAAVGVDIGCGMIAVRSQFTAEDMRGRGDAARHCASRSRASFRCRLGSTTPPFTARRTADRIASSSSWTARTAPSRPARTGGSSWAASARVTTSSRSAWTRRTGSGCSCTPGRAGSGNRLARKHIKVAQELAKKWWIPLADPDLAYLVEDTDEFSAYLRDLRWAQHFALLNRDEMMDRVIGCLSDWLEQPVEASETVNTHHNYTEREKHFGKDVWLSRKGAIDASAGKPGLIPGSMGTRVLRGDREGQPAVAQLLAARRRPRVQPERRAQGVQPGRARRRHAGHRVAADQRVPGRDPGGLQGHRRVMDDARDLVEVRHTLRQIVNVKGD